MSPYAINGGGKAPFWPRDATSDQFLSFVESLSVWLKNLRSLAGANHAVAAIWKDVDHPANKASNPKGAATSLNYFLRKYASDLSIPVDQFLANSESIYGAIDDLDTPKQRCTRSRV
jgi:hypothetical protein